MSQEIEAVESLYLVFNRAAEDGDVVPYITSCFDHECEYLPIELGTAVAGHDALIRYFIQWSGIFESR